MYATRLDERVYLLDTFALGQKETVAAYVVKGPEVTLVDCGYASSYQNVLLGLAEVGVEPSDVRLIMPTHVHLDHAGAAGHLLKEMPNARVLAHEKGVRHLVDPTRLIESATRVFGETTMGLYGSPLPIPSERVSSVGDGVTVDLGEGLTATVIHTPGHAPHQMSLLLEPSKMLITADAVGIVYPNLNTLIPTTPPPSFDPGLLVSSVDSLEKAAPERLLVPHYGAKSEVNAIFDATREKVPAWTREVREMKEEGMALDEISEAMQRKVEEEAGTDEIPVYARVSVRSSVMGILNYLSKNV